MSHHIVGGFSETMKATEETLKLCDQVKSQVEKETGMNYTEFTAVKYRVQIVAGTNFLIKAHVGSSYIHLLVFKALPCKGGEVVLSGVLQNQTIDSPLETFK